MLVIQLRWNKIHEYTFSWFKNCYQNTSSTMSVQSCRTYRWTSLVPYQVVTASLPLGTEIIMLIWCLAGLSTETMLNPIPVPYALIVNNSGHSIVWYQYWIRADSRFAPSQWETALLCNDIFHWLGTSLESALLNCRFCVFALSVILLVYFVR